jgi:hypothetical protein
LSFNQWATICKTKQINESLLNRQLNSGEEEFDDASMIEASSVLLPDDKIKVTIFIYDEVVFVDRVLNCYHLFKVGWK